MSTHDTHGHEAHAHHPTGRRRFVYSTNHKDIGTMYLLFAVVAGLIGGAISVYMRMELAHPGVQYMVNADGSPNGQLWNVFITAHGLIMIFFVVMPAMIGGLVIFFRSPSNEPPPRGSPLLPNLDAFPYLPPSL